MWILGLGPDDVFSRSSGEFVHSVPPASAGHHRSGFNANSRPSVSAMVRLDCSQQSCIVSHTDERNVCYQVLRAELRSWWTSRIGGTPEKPLYSRLEGQAAREATP